MKKGKVFKILFIVIAVVISFNVALVYITAPASNADENIVVVDKDIEVNTNIEKPTFADAVECYMFAETKLVQTSCYSTITGYVKGSALDKVMVYQTMYNERIIDNDLYRYSTSKSLKQGTFGKDTYQKVAFDTKSENGLIYKMVTKKAKSDGTPDFSGCKWTSYTQSQYIEITGDVPGKMMYIVRPSTVRKTEIFEQLEDGTYHLKILLNNRSSVTGYKKLVKQSAGSLATGYPAFSYVCVEAWVDENGNFIKHIMDDTASIPMGFGALSVDCKMVSHYEETFVITGGEVNQPFEVPYQK